MYFFILCLVLLDISLLLELINIEKIVILDILNRFHRFSSCKRFYDGSIFLFLSEVSILFLPQYSFTVKASGKTAISKTFIVTFLNDFKEGCSCVTDENRKSCERSVNTLFFNPCMAKTKRPSSNSVSDISYGYPSGLAGRFVR